MIGPFEQTLLAVMVFVIMLGLGASLSPRDFLSALQRPSALGIGLISQFGFMPVAGFVLASALQLPPPIAIGLIILSCMPGGPTSNLFTYLSRGDLALSVSMTVASTIIGVVLIPVVLTLSLSAMNLEVPLRSIAATLTLVLVPLALGMIVRWVRPGAARVTERLGAVLGVAFIVFIVLSWIPRNLSFLSETAPTTFIAAIMLGICGFAFGRAVAGAARLSRPMAFAVTLETGIQNAPLAIAIIMVNFAAEDQQGTLAVIALYSLFIVAVAALVTLRFRRAEASETA